MKKGEIYREKVNSKQGYEDWKVTGEKLQGPNGVNYYALENDKGVQWFDSREIKEMKRKTTQNEIRGQKKMKRAVKARKTKKVRPNPFAGVDDVYLTKNKIAVTTIQTQRQARGNVLTQKTKYYTRSQGNIKQLKDAQGSEIRRGRNGTKYERI